MNRLIALGIAFLALISCGKNKDTFTVDVEIENLTSKHIGMIYLSTASDEARTEEKAIEPNGVLLTRMDFSSVTKSDGAYSLHYQFADSTETERFDFGYYTNGIPLESKFTITVHTDSVSIKSNPRDLGQY